MRTIKKHNRIISQLCMGTAQLGMPYGIANTTGMPSLVAAEQLLVAANKSNITFFDTARAYGEAETRLGLAIPKMQNANIITKLAPLQDITEQDSKTSIRTKVEASIEASLSNLGLKALPYVLLHRAEHFHRCGGHVWKALCELKQAGMIEHLGVSVQNPQELLDALNVPDVECIQLPFNVLDWRYEKIGIPELLEKHPEIIVFARSALLQGLLTQPAELWPVIPREKANHIISALDKLTEQFGRKSRVDLCFAYVRSQKWIDSVVVGMENIAQLEDNLEMFETPNLSEDACRIIREQFSDVEEVLLNPASWPKKKEM